MNTSKYKSILSFSFLILITIACKKEFLSIKPDQALVIPSTLKDFQAIADNTAVMTGDQRNGMTPLLGELGADNHLYLDNTWVNLSIIEKNSYIWIKDTFAPSTLVGDWVKPYIAVFYANVILQGLEKIPPGTNTAEKNNLQGMALFYRAHAFFQLLQIFAAQYDAEVAKTALGIPLPLNVDVMIQNKRETMEKCYQQVIQDLEQSSALLPETPLYKTRPCKIAVQGLLSRIYLTMGNYDQAFTHANAYLSTKDQLLNFNTLPLADARPVPHLSNPEITFYSVMNSFSSTQPPTTLVAPGLYQLYPANDLRIDAFFKTQSGQTQYKVGNYTGGSQYFSGIGTSEILLIRAECYARNNNKDAAIADLNKLLQNRIATASYIPVQATTAEQALNLVLLERRKELCFRGLRWMDLRRLNKEPAFATTLTRTVSGITYTLLPNDPKYTYPIPITETDYNPMPQNER